MPSVFTLALANTVAATSEVSSATATENVGYFAGLLDKYGTTTVVMAVFLFCFIAISLYTVHTNKKLTEGILKNQDTYEDNFQKIIKQVMETYLSQIGANNKEETKEAFKETVREEKDAHKAVVTSYINSNLAFKDASHIAINKTKAQRIAIYLFHNGNSTPYGYPFAKMSCTHECTLKGNMTVRAYTHQNVPLHAFSELVDALDENGELAISNIYDHSIINTDDQMLEFISGSTTQSFFALAIKNHEDNGLAAFTIAEFSEPTDFSNPDIYTRVKSALQDMNDNIYSIVVDEGFRNNYTRESH